MQKLDKIRMPKTEFFIIYLVDKISLFSYTYISNTIFFIYNKMTFALPTIILRHRKENKKKCSLSGLKSNKNIVFFSYPYITLPDLDSYIILSMHGETLSEKDKDKGLFFVDGTWRYAKKMTEKVTQEKKQLNFRSLPFSCKTAYPRKQTDCPDPERGLASIEALFIAYHITKRNTDNLLDHYYWKEKFLDLNKDFLSTAP